MVKKLIKGQNLCEKPEGAEIGLKHVSTVYLRSLIIDDKKTIMLQGSKIIQP
jgi:hypothetical protein